MHIIPVIDLLNGAVVHAKQGARHNYQPIKSLLTASSQPLDVVAALLDLHPFTQLYIADLNAIQKLNGNNFEVIKAIAARFPTLEMWLDAGFSHIDELKMWQHLNVRPVLGSENFAHLENYLAFQTDFILSLDFMPEANLAKNNAAASQYPCAFRGSLELLDNAKYWPQNVIVMALAQVGANAGVNVALLQKILALKTDQSIYAAGGVRGLEDLITLKNIGVHGVLIATALHQKQLSAAEIISLNQ